jgi:hypothetical protein
VQEFRQSEEGLDACDCVVEQPSKYRQFKQFKNCMLTMPKLETTADVTRWAACASHIGPRINRKTIAFVVISPFLRMDAFDGDPFEHGLSVCCLNSYKSYLFYLVCLQGCEYLTPTVCWM